jgi:uncharacterized membrane protein
MIKIIILVVFYFAFPVVIIFFSKKWTFLQKLGTIVLAYLFGLILGSSGILPRGGDEYKAASQGKPPIPSQVLEQLISEGKLKESDRFVNQVAAVQDLIPTLIVPLAFPLLLFSMNIKRWLKYAGKGFVSVVLALISGIVMVTIGFFIWKNSIPESWKLAGMFEGIYAGATANFVALKLALDVDPNLFILVNTYDMLVGAFLVLFFITVAPKLFRLILPTYTADKGISIEDESMVKEIENLEDFSGMFKKETFLPLLKALGLSVIIFALSGGLSLLFPKLPQMVVVILSVTTLAILASLIESINKIQKTFQLGMYFILVFSLVLASMADLKTIFNIGMINLILFISWCYFGSLLLHLLLARIFRVDADNFLITAAAFIFSPPFVPLVASKLKNRDVIVTGITGGIIGFVLGNYLGILLAHILKGL